MRIARISVLTLIALTLGLSLARAEDMAPSTQPSGGVSGTYKWTQSFGGNDQETVLTLKQDGNKLTGTITGFGGNEDEIKDGTVNGNNITFKVTRDFNG